jgi:hypothetical protein
MAMCQSFRETNDVSASLSPSDRRRDATVESEDGGEAGGHVDDGDDGRAGRWW